MSLKELNNKKIAVLGLGAENYSLLKYVLPRKRIKAEFVVCDSRGRKDLGARYRDIRSVKSASKVEWQLGGKYDRNLREFDLVLRSPGYPAFCPPLVRAQENGVVISSPMNLFLANCPTKNTIGVTGTKGKGTTSSLLAHILEAAGKKVWLGGNIGIPPFDFLPKVKRSDWVVLELSSFQLEDMNSSPRIAVMTNFFPDHLSPADPNNPNYHKSLDIYWKAKLRVMAWQGRRDHAVINYSLRKLHFPYGHGKLYFFRKSKLPSRLAGVHNQENVGAAVAVANILRLRKKDVREAVATFKPLPHRLEPVKNIGGVDFYDDSFATTPESTITALYSFARPVVLIAGGADKNSEFGKLAKLVHRNVKFVSLLPGKGGDRLARALRAEKYPKTKIARVKNLGEAITKARHVFVPGDVCLLSPACASFGIFKNYKQRGEIFKKEVKKIKKL